MLNLSILDNSAVNVGPWWLEAYNSLTRHVVLFATAVFFQARRPKYNCTFQTDLTWIFLRYQNDGLLSIHLNDTNISYFALVGTLFIMPIPKQIYLNLNLTLDSLIVSHQKMHFWSSVINRVYEISVLWLVRLIAPGDTSYKTRPQWQAERGSSIILRIWGFLLTRLSPL